MKNILIAAYLSGLMWAALRLPLCAGPALADGFILETGNDLYDLCSSKPRRAACTAYIAGVVDTLNNPSGPSGMVNYGVPCGALNVTPEQLADIVMKYLEVMPENRNMAASSLVSAAVVVTFGCHK